MPRSYFSDPSEKIVTSLGGRAAYQVLKLAKTVALSTPFVGSTKQPREKCGAISHGRSILGSRTLSLWTFVLGHCLVPVPLPLII